MSTSIEFRKLNMNNSIYEQMYFEIITFLLIVVEK